MDIVRRNSTKCVHECVRKKWTRWTSLCRNPTNFLRRSVRSVRIHFFGTDRPCRSSPHRWMKSSYSLDGATTFLLVNLLSGTSTSGPTNTLIHVNISRRQRHFLTTAMTLPTAALWFVVRREMRFETETLMSIRVWLEFRTKYVMRNLEF